MPLHVVSWTFGHCALQLGIVAQWMPFFAETAFVLGRHRDSAFLASWKGSEMESIWSDAISVALHLWPTFFTGSAFSVRRVNAGLLMSIMIEIGT